MSPDQIKTIFNISGEKSILKSALEIFRYQAEKNPVYRNFIDQLGIGIDSVRTLSGIPFLPVDLFKRHMILNDGQREEIIFESSGTTGSDISRHYVSDLSLYERSFSDCFRMFYNDPEDYFIAALLPSYTERKSSSLVYMMDKLIKKSSYSFSGFYRDNIRELISNVEMAKSENRKTLLIGVSYALLDLAEGYSPDLAGVIIMETGGMKGRRKELTRSELHEILIKSFNTDVIHSEYGMTELLSQAYSKGNGKFFTPPWMKVMIRDPEDPLSVIQEIGITGGINVIDLANVNSCSFISTSDLGKLHEDGGFEVLGRFDNSDIRGCNLLID